MDAMRFDRLVKAGSGLGSRRSALGVLGAVIAGIALSETQEPVAAHHHHHHHHPPKPDPDLCLNPIDPVACQFSNDCNGCVTAAGHLCKNNPCVTTDLTFSCMSTKEGTNVCVRQPSGTACPDFPRCTNSKACGKGHVCGHSCCNNGQLRCFPRCSNTTAPRVKATVPGTSGGPAPMPRR